MATIGVTGSYGGLNIGDEAILTVILEGLRRERPDDELLVFSRDADHTREHHAADRVVDVRQLSREDARPEVKNLDLLVVGGGGILYDTEARIYLREAALAQEHGVPTCAFAVGAGPLDDPYDRTAVAETLNGMDAVSVRDELSKRVLEDVGVTRPIEVVADPALLLSTEEFPADKFRDEGVDVTGRLVGVSVREPGKAATDLDEDGYHALLANAADFAVRRFDADVVFVPMEKDDLRHSHAVIARMVAAQRAHVLQSPYGPRQVLGAMAHFDVVMGMRLHVLMFAAICGVPFLALPYAGKVGGFAEAVGLPPPAPVHRESAGPLLAEIDRLWDNRQAQTAHLRDRVSPLQERSKAAFRAPLALLSQRTDARL